LKVNHLVWESPLGWALTVLFPAMALGAATPTFSPTPALAFTPTATSTTVCCQGVTDLTGQSGHTLNGAGLSVDYAHQRLYAADFFNNAVQVFDSETEGPITLFSALGAGATLLNPIDTALDAAGNLYVAAEGNQAVEKFDTNYNYVGAIAAGQGLSVVGVCVSGNAVFISTTQDLILEYAGTGASYSAAATFGGPGNLSNPNEMAKVGNDLYVADTFNGRVVKFDVNAPSAVPTVVQASLFYPTGLRTDLAGNFYVGESDNGGVAQFVDRYDPTFTTRENQCPLADVWGPAINASGQVFVSGLNSFAVTVLQSCVVEPVPTSTPSFQGFNPPGAGADFIYPSPARGTQARVVYFMTGPGRMKMTVWNEAAERRAEVTDQKPAGSQSTAFDISGWATGVYFYALTLNYDSGAVQKLPPQKFAVIH
jgi:sugar lactone lactonase YvrE